jgi:hypothetical protein
MESTYLLSHNNTAYTHGYTGRCLFYLLPAPPDLHDLRGAFFSPAAGKEENVFVSVVGLTKANNRNKESSKYCAAAGKKPSIVGNRITRVLYTTYAVHSFRLQRARNTETKKQKSVYTQCWILQRFEYISTQFR